MFVLDGCDAIEEGEIVACNTERGLLRIRKELGLFANLRPASVFPALVAASSLRPEIVEERYKAHLDTQGENARVVMEKRAEFVLKERQKLQAQKLQKARQKRAQADKEKEDLNKVSSK